MATDETSCTGKKHSHVEEAGDSAPRIIMSQMVGQFLPSRNARTKHAQGLLAKSRTSGVDAIDVLST
jgi:hypothetical protein